MSQSLNNLNLTYHKADGTTQASNLRSDLVMEFGETEAIATYFTGVEFLFFIKLGKNKEFLRFSYSEIDHFTFDQKRTVKLFYKDGGDLMIYTNKGNAETCRSILISRGLPEAEA